MMYNPYHEADITKIASVMISEICSENRLRHLRRQIGYTQEELAERSGVSVKTIRAYEQGKLELMNAGGGILYRLSKALHCRIEDLLVL